VQILNTFYGCRVPQELKFWFQNKGDCQCFSGGIVR